MSHVRIWAMRADSVSIFSIGTVGALYLFSHEIFIHPADSDQIRKYSRNKVCMLGRCNTPIIGSAQPPKASPRVLAWWQGQQFPDNATNSRAPGYRWPVKRGEACNRGGYIKAGAQVF